MIGQSALRERASVSGVRRDEYAMHLSYTFPAAQEQGLLRLFILIFKRGDSDGCSQEIRPQEIVRQKSSFRQERRTA